MGEVLSVAEDSVVFDRANLFPGLAVRDNLPKDILDRFGLSEEVQDVLKQAYFGSNWDSFFARFCRFAQSKKYTVENLSRADAMQLLRQMNEGHRS